MKQRSLLYFILPMFMATEAMAASVEATVDWAKRSVLSVPVSGIVAQVAVRPGERVKQGQILIALDKTPFEAAVVQAHAEVVRRTTEFEEAKRDYEQAKALYERTVLAAVELENAKNKNLRAEAALKHARAALKHANYELERSRIAAPFDAWVLAVKAQEGETVIANLEPKPLVTVAAHGQYVARARVGHALRQTLKLNQPAKVSAAGQSYSGTVVAIGLEPAAGARLDGAAYEIEISFSAEGAALAAGDGARIELP